MTAENQTEIQALREAVLTLVKTYGPRLTREQMRQRYGVSNPTLNLMIEREEIPRPGVGGKWLLSEVMEWESHKARKV